LWTDSLYRANPYEVEAIKIPAGQPCSLDEVKGTQLLLDIENVRFRLSAPLPLFELPLTALATRLIRTARTG
jgi:hypothetical protein